MKKLIAFTSIILAIVIGQISDLGFEMMPGTGAQELTPEQSPFKQEAMGDTASG